MYAELGDYHRELDPNWSYAPTYMRKLLHADRFIDGLPAEARILDVGCGEGVLVERYLKKGRRIEGIDLNYESRHVRRASVSEIPAANGTYDALLFLDVLEHLSFVEQPLALRELRRVMKDDGRLLVTVPNLAHLNSRFRLFFRGRLDRTDVESTHIGERPWSENADLLRDAGLQIVRMAGITATFPLLYRRVICRNAAKYRWLHDLLEPFATPALAMITVFECGQDG